MKYSRASAALVATTLVSYVAATVTMNIARGPKLNRHSLAARGPITAVLRNSNTGSYFVEVSVGSPGQKQTMILDTGSSDVWLLSSTADLCTDPRRDGCTSTFDHSNSSTYKVDKEGGFNISYVDKSGASGDYIWDDFQIDGATIKTLEMGLANKTTIGTGIIGIGYSMNEASDSSNSAAPFLYPSIIENLFSQGLIARKAYSLYLNDLDASTGSIIFGGIDADKYHGDLFQMPVVPSHFQNGSSVYLDLGVALTSFGITGQYGNTLNLTSTGFNEVGILDSGTTETYLPTSLVAKMYKGIGAIDDSNRTGNVYIDCDIKKQSPDLTINYGFGGPSGLSIAIPIHELVFDIQDFLANPHTKLPTLPFSKPCGFGIYDGGHTGPYLLGDTFVRSAYVVYDLEANVIAMAQTNFNSSSSCVVEFQANATGMPMVSGIPTVMKLAEVGSENNGGGNETDSVTGIVATDTVGVLTGSTSVPPKTTAAATTVTMTSARSSTTSQSQKATA
ncbi:putative aspartic-type endopeptidase, partial [Lachnellula occidentalis]